MTDLIVTRDVTPNECEWLSETIQAGTRVRRFLGVTYGCIGHSGVAVSYTDDYPFFELPRDAVQELTSKEAPWKSDQQDLQDAWTYRERQAVHVIITEDAS